MRIGALYSQMLRVTAKEVEQTSGDQPGAGGLPGESDNPRYIWTKFLIRNKEYV